jgi:threonyl-tRNA synthetase
VIHRAILGSLERFIGVYLEHTGGHLPLWLAPVQVVIATITSEADDFARKVARQLLNAGMRAETDLRNEKINYKVREHSLAKVPVILVCGKREAEEGSVNIRRLGEKDQKSMALGDAVAALVDEATPPDVKRRRAE